MEDVSIWKILVYVFLFIFVLIAIAFLLESAGLEIFKHFAPQYEDAKREVFENSKSYTHGKKQELANYYHEYKKGSQKRKTQ